MVAADLEPCTACHMAKQRKGKFDRSFIAINNIFDLVHIDVWKPYSQFTLTGSEYFITFIDETSRETQVMNPQNHTKLTLLNTSLVLKSLDQKGVRLSININSF